MNAYLFRSYTQSQYDYDNGRSGQKQYVVAEASSRSVAAGKAMRKVYALNRYHSSLHNVSLEYLGTIEVAR